LQSHNTLQRLKEKVSGAVSRGEFTLASGKKSNFYFDCRLVTLDAEGAHLAAKAMLAIIRELGATAVGGMSMGADPLVSTIGHLSHLEGSPLKMFYVRKEAKKHGKGKRIEGPPLSGEDRVVIVEDVTTTGGSALKAVEAVRNEFGTEVLTVLTLVDRQEGAQDNLTDKNLKLISLFKAEDF